ncbi:MAG: hypothetical protein GY698_24145 [Actinomycetia bacterium]|nr:hypothetical protein [Actinomycetes bacterium]
MSPSHRLVRSTVTVAGPSFGEGVCHGTPHGRAQDLEAFAAEDLGEGVDELAAVVTNQRPSAFEPFAVGDE